jgi:hypothetical protein
MLSNSLALLAALGMALGAHAQLSELPDSPGAVMQAAVQMENSQPASSSSAASASSDSPVAPSPVSPIYPGRHPYIHRIVPPDVGPQPLTGGQKFELSLRSSISVMSFGSAFISAGWSHLNNSRPHYGSDRAGFGERLGAAKLKASSESFFSYGLWATVFREDPHYYVMGPTHSIGHRALYAATRVVITRKDSGGTGVNYAKLFGVASSNALVNTYYPDTDRGFRPSITAYGTNLLTTAATNQIDEFLPQLIKAVRHKKSH